MKGTRHYPAFFLFLWAALLWPSLALAAVQALFNLETPKGGPFPSDRFTVADRSHLTGLRVSLPSPDCSERPSDCEEMNVINALDGFNLQPRLSIPFDGPIDVDTVSSGTVFLIELRCRDDDDDDDDGEEECDDDDGRRAKVVGINQVVWDTFTNSLHVESDEFLDQHTRYALIVTRGIRDESGRPIEATQAFRRFRQTVRGPYKRALLDAIHAARRLGVREGDIAVASVFTTQSATAIMEKIRDQIKGTTPEPADFNLGPGGTRTVFPLDAVTGITFNRHTRVSPPGFTPFRVPVELLEIIPGAVGQIAFGKYVSPDYEVHPGEFIPPVGTRTGIPTAQGTNEIHFNLFIPSGRKPTGGWPVAIFGPGAASSKDEQTFKVASTMAAHGLATIAINDVGHGFGVLGTLTVRQTGGGTVTFLAGGRGIDQNGDGIIGNTEGRRAVSPRTIIADRDARRQSVADLMKLVRVIEIAMDVDGDSISDLDSSRIYFFGQALSGMQGTILLAIEPSVWAGVFTAPAGPQIDSQRLGSNRPNVGMSLGSRVPSLINSPGITMLGGIAAPTPNFNENLPLRDGIPLTVRLADGTSYDIQSPVINTVQGAIEIQEVFENSEWVTQSGDPIPYAAHLRRDPLAGVPAKSVIYQFAKGDQIAPNPRSGAILRAGDLADRATFFRSDLAFAENPAAVLKNPHRFMVDIDIPALTAIARGAQEQIAVFFASDGKEIIHPEPARFFEVPIVLPLPEGLNYIP